MPDIFQGHAVIFNVCFSETGFLKDPNTLCKQGLF